MRDENEEQEWEVEKVLAQRGSARKREYLVKWSGYPVWESTWEKEKQLENAQGKLREFKKQADGLEAEWREQIMCIFKGVESVIGESGHHGDKEVVESEE
jgi:chromo domain-containing protein 1